MVEDGDKDIMFGSEVGGFGAGFRTAAIQAAETLEKPFGKGSLRYVEVDNYMAVWGFGWRR